MGEGGARSGRRRRYFWQWRQKVGPFVLPDRKRNTRATASVLLTESRVTASQCIIGPSRRRPHPTPIPG